MRRAVTCSICSAVLACAILAGCTGDARPEQAAAEAAELRNNHARTIADVSERDLRLAALAKSENAAGTSAELARALAYDLSEVEYLLNVYDNARSPDNHAIERNTARRLAALRDQLRQAGAVPAAQPAAPAKKR